MLPPDSRVVLVDALRPSPGAEFDRGVALTFTLDLESALVAPLAFAGSHLRSEGPDPIEILHAARSCADRLDIFCQAGQVRVPSSPSDLLSLLEPMVHPVAPPHGALFHPKLWVVRYLTSDGSYEMRLLIGSRNLTGDRSWDTCLRLDGIRSGGPKATNRPLAGLLRHAMRLAVPKVSDARAAAITALIEDVRRTEWELPEGADGLEFFTPGVPGAKRPDFPGSRAALISPFWNEGGMKIVGQADDLIVVGRQEELDRLPEQHLDGVDTYVLNELAGLGATEGERSTGLLTGLHAKIYVTEYNRRAWMYVGSANATDAAFTHNVELLACLTGGAKMLGIDALMGHETGLADILEVYERRPPVNQDETEHELENALRAAAAVALTATAVKEEDGDDAWMLRLSSTESMPVRDGITFTVSLLTGPQHAKPAESGAPLRATFEGLALTDITPFIVVTATFSPSRRVSAVVLADLVSDPAERLDRLLARQIDSPEKFLKFLALLLSLGGLFEQFGGGVDRSAQGTWRMDAGTPVLELLLNALADRPDQLLTLGRLVERLRSTDDGKKALPAGFLEVWDVVEASHTMVKGRTRHGG